MKVLHITGFITGGAGIAVKRLHESLLDKGIDSKVLCMFSADENITREIYPINKPKSLWEKVTSRLKIDKANRLIGNLSGEFEAFTLPFSRYKLHEHELVRDADIIHLHWISDFVDFPSFFPNVKQPIVWTAHDLNPILGGFHYEEDVRRNPSFGSLEKKLTVLKHDYIKKSGLKFIGSSTVTVDKIKAYIPEANCTYIPCILDTVHFKPVEKKIAKAAFDLAEDYLILGTGADDLKNYRKGYWLLRSALSMLSKEDRSLLKILCFGTMKENDQSDEAPEIIRFEPVHNKKLHSLLYSCMDYFVAPSIEETFGLTGTEALLCNTPIIASKTGGMIDYSQNEKSNMLFEPGNVEQLLSKLKDAITQKRLMKLSGSSPRESILQWYEEQDPLNQHIKLYQEMYQKQIRPESS